MSDRFETITMKLTSQQKSRFIVDATYILHIENEPGLAETIDDFKKHGRMDTLHIYTTSKSRTEGYQVIFNDANRRAHSRVLIVEDGCRMTSSNEDIEEVNDFLQKNSSVKFAYPLGSLPVCMFPIEGNHFRTFPLRIYACIYNNCFLQNEPTSTVPFQFWELGMLMHCPLYTYTRALFSYEPSTSFFMFLVRQAYVLSRYAAYIVIVIVLILALLIIKRERVYGFLKDYKIREKTIEERINRLRNKCNLMLPHNVRI